MKENERESKSKSAAGMVTASAMKKGPMKHNFARIEIHPAANGFTVLHHKPMPEKKEGGPYMMPAEPEPTVFGGEDAQDAMLKHIGDIVGQGKAPGNKDQASGSSKDKKPASGKMDAEDKKGENANTGDDDEDDE